jgi:hypothetical protein
MKSLFITCILALSVGCTNLQLPIKTVPQYGPETLISTLISIQDSAMDKEATKEIPTSSARIIIKFTNESLKTTKSVTDEATYKGLIDAELTQVRKDLPVVDENKFTGKFDFLHKILTQR